MHLESGAKLVRNPASRFSFIREGDTVALFVDGECFECGAESAAFAERLCAEDQPSASVDDAELVSRLVNQGSIAFEQP